MVRRTDTVARLGGDEFAVLLPHLDDPTEPLAFAETIRSVFDAPVRLGEMAVEIQASIGIAVTPEDGTDTATLLQRADVAMYEAKRNKTFVQRYDSSSDEHTVERARQRIRPAHPIAERRQPLALPLARAPERFEPVELAAHARALAIARRIAISATRTPLRPSAKTATRKAASSNSAKNSAILGTTTTASASCANMTRTPTFRTARRATLRRAASAR